MGNHISYTQGSVATRKGKVILPDGSIQEFNESITAAELMLEHPQQVVIELKEAPIQKREYPTPLPADKKLEVDKFYVVIPSKRGKLAHLSPLEARLIFLRASTALRSKTSASSAKFLPLLARIWQVGIKDSHHKIAVSKKELLSEGREMKEDDDGGLEGLDLIERAYYLKRQVYGKGWKPCLDTIEEKQCENSEVSNWVSLAIKAGKRIEHKGLVWG